FLSVCQRTATTVIYTLSLHDALPICAQDVGTIMRNEGVMTNKGFEVNVNSRNMVNDFRWTTDFNISFNRNRLDDLELQKIYNARSEEHTSELQSRENLVCRLLLEKKK